MTGTVTSIEGKQRSYCHIRDSTGTVYFAHQFGDFEDPDTMVVGMEVEFVVKLAKIGIYPGATNVVALHRKAA